MASFVRACEQAGPPSNNCFVLPSSSFSRHAHLSRLLLTKPPVEDSRGEQKSRRKKRRKLGKRKKRREKKEKQKQKQKTKEKKKKTKRRKMTSVGHLCRYETTQGRCWCRALPYRARPGFTLRQQCYRKTASVLHALRCAFCTITVTLRRSHSFSAVTCIPPSSLEHPLGLTSDGGGGQAWVHCHAWP